MSIWQLNYSRSHALTKRGIVVFITPDCPEFMEFMKWFEEKARPKYEKFYAHADTCSKAQAWAKCQQTVIDIKGWIELKMIQTSDAELFKAMKEL